MTSVLTRGLIADPAPKESARTEADLKDPVFNTWDETLIEAYLRCFLSQNSYSLGIRLEKREEDRLWAKMIVHQKNWSGCVWSSDALAVIREVSSSDPVGRSSRYEVWKIQEHASGLN